MHSSLIEGGECVGVDQLVVNGVSVNGVRLLQCMFQDSGVHLCWRLRWESSMQTSQEVWYLWHT